MFERLKLAKNKAEKAEAQALEAYQHVTRLIVRGDAAKLTPGLIEEFGGRIYRTYKYFPGFAVEMPLENVEAFAQHENVAGVSEDVPTSGTAYDDIALITGAEAAAETYGTGGAGIDIAVIDSGIAQVTDLRSSLIGRVDFTMFPDSSWFDPFGHGTHVAGIIAGDGIASDGQYGGIAPRASLIDLRALDANGRGFTSDALAAVEWAIQHRNSKTVDGRDLNIRVINLSLGHAPYEPAETDPLSMICRIAVEHGIVVVAAAGNFGEVDGAPASGGITSPGIEPSVITVGAMTAWGTPSRADDTVASYSSRGPTRYDAIIKPDLVAPGTQIVAPSSPGNLIARSYPQVVVDSNHMWLSGTSMSAPMVSGAVALVLEANPHLTPNQVKAILMFTAEDTAANPLEEGAGYLNIAGAVNLASNVDATTAIGAYWLANNGADLDYSNVISGYPAVWSETIVWGKSLYQIDDFDYNETSYSETIVWGKTIAWQDF